MFLDMLLERIFIRNPIKLLKRDYLKLKKMYIINYESFWCMEENRVLLNIEREGIGG
ncbi:MAG: hypothetical protein PWQ96_1922 [Clostridia bacterium]|jgi:hypothetical protein|nr:hypothetical protein [Clostridiales bacterium]MDK2986278.1 hypothetical protein [Clostridia bacterium]